MRRGGAFLDLIPKNAICESEWAEFSFVRGCQMFTGIHEQCQKVINWSAVLGKCKVCVMAKVRPLCILDVPVQWESTIIPSLCHCT